MHINKDRLRVLLEKYSIKSATQEEVNELLAMMQEGEEEAVQSVVAEMLEVQQPDYNSDRTEMLLRKVLTGSVKESDAPIKTLYPGRGILRRGWMKVAVAAAVLGFVIWSLLFVIGRDKGVDLPVAVSPTEQDVKAPDVNRAMITLADGRTVYLDSAGVGSLAIQQGVEVVKNADGVIQYTLRQAQGDIPIYNTLTNPRGSRVIDITLSDGSFF